MNKKGNNSSSVNWKKIVGIIAAIVVIIILILSLVSCQKKASSDNKKDKKVEEKDKKPKKNDKDKLTFTDENVSYRLSEKKTTPIVSNLSNKSSESLTPTVEKYSSEILLNGDPVTRIEWKQGEYSEEGAKYVNIKNNTIVSSGEVEDITIYKDGEKVDGIDNTEIGEYKVIYTYTNPDKVTITKTRTVMVQDTIPPEALATGYVINGKYVVKLSDVSEELSDWDNTTYTKEFDEKVETVTITDVNGLNNEIDVNYEQNAPEITPNATTNKYDAVYTFTVNDDSDITRVYLSDGTELDPANNYQHTFYDNGNYTVYAEDALGNVGEAPISVTGVQDLSLTPTEIQNALVEGSTQHTPRTTVYTKTITPKTTTDTGGAEIKVVSIKYVSLDDRHNDINVNSFKNNRIYGQNVQTGSLNGFTATNNTARGYTTQNRYYYICYTVEKSYPGKQPVTETVVRLVDVN